MAILRKKKVNYYKRYDKRRISRYLKFKINNKKIFFRKKFFFKKRIYYINPWKLNFREKIFIKNKLFKVFFKKYRSYIARSRINFIFLKNWIFKYTRSQRKNLWMCRYYKSMKYFLKRFYKNKKIKNIQNYRIIFLFYKKYNLYRFFREFIKYTRLRRILKRKGRVFRNRKKVLNRKIYLDRTDYLDTLYRFNQLVMSRGKGGLSFSILHRLFLLLKFKYKNLFIKKFIESLDYIRPLLVYKTMYISGKKYKIPLIMSTRKSYLVAMRWIISLSSANSPVFVFNAVNDSLSKKGAVIKMRKEHHALAFENKSYVRFLRFLKRGF